MTTEQTSEKFYICVYLARSSAAGRNSQHVSSLINLLCTMTTRQTFETCYLLARHAAVFSVELLILGSSSILLLRHRRRPICSAHRHTDTHTDTHKHKDTHTHTHTRTHTRTNTLTQIFTFIHWHRHRYTHMRLFICGYEYWALRLFSSFVAVGDQSVARTDTQTNRHTRTDTQTRRHIRTHTYAHS